MEASSFPLPPCKYLCRQQDFVEIFISSFLVSIPLTIAAEFATTGTISSRYQQPRDYKFTLISHKRCCRDARNRGRIKAWDSGSA